MNSVEQDTGVTALRGESRAGARAAAAWLSARGLFVPPAIRWEVSITLETTTGSTLTITIDAKEWGFTFVHGIRTSSIRVTDVPCVRDRDDFKLLPNVPPLRNLGTLVQALEDKHEIAFRRQAATIRTNIAGAEQKIRIWAVASL